MYSMSATTTPLERSSRLIRRLTLTLGEQARIDRVIISFLLGAGEFPGNAYDQVAWATPFVSMLEEAAPRLVQAMRDVRAGKLVACYVRGLPEDTKKAALVLLANSIILGKPFNYSGQCGGQLVMRLVPAAGSMGNTNTTRDDFQIHTDDAALPRDARTEFINLYGIINPPGTMTSYAAAADAVSDLEPSLVDALREDRYSLRFPLSFGFGAEMWSSPAPILAGTDDDLELRFPSYAVKPSRDGDSEALMAIEKLTEALNRHAVPFALDAGCFLTFNNSRGAHRRDAIGSGDRLVLRTYSARTLDFLQSITAQQGPIFSIESYAKKIHR